MDSIKKAEVVCETASVMSSAMIGRCNFYRGNFLFICGVVNNFRCKSQKFQDEQNYFFNKYFYGIFCFLLSIFTGVLNEALMKYLSYDFSVKKTVCIRYMLAAASLQMLQLFNFSMKIFITKYNKYNLTLQEILLIAFMNLCYMLITLKNTYKASYHF